MQPPAEMVHWLFATGLLLLGLCLVCEGIVGEEVWRMRRWRAYLWPGLVFAMGVLMWPVMTFYTNSAIHMYAHGSWAEVLFLAGGAELGLVHGRLKSRWWHLTMPFAFVVTGIAFIVHEQNTWFFARSAFLHHLLGWTFLLAAIFPLGMVIGRAHASSGRDSRSRSSFWPRCSTPTATWPRSSATCRPTPGCRTDETRLILIVSSRWPFRPQRSPTRRCGRRRRTSPPSSRRPAHDPLPLRPGGADRSGLGRGARRERQELRRSRPHREDRHRRGRAGAAARAVHGSLARDLGRLARRLGRLDVRCRRAGAPGHGAYGAGGPTTVEHVVRWLWFLALALTIGSLGFRLICLRGLAVPLELERRLAVAAGLGVAVALQVGIAAFSLRAEDALQLPFGRFLYGDLSPMTQTRFGEAFIVMTLGFAVVLALIFLSWLTDRVVLLVPAFVASIIFTAGLSVSGHDAVDEARHGSRRPPTGFTSRGPRSGSAGSRRWSPWSGTARPSSGAWRSSASRGWRRC